jgi:hypothetical protein
MASYANSNLPKQYAVVAVSKQPPVRVRIPDVPDAKISKEVEQSFISNCLSHQWNFTPQQIREQMKKRFNEQTTNTRPPKERTTPDRKTTGGASKRPKSVFDD